MTAPYAPSEHAQQVALVCWADMATVAGLKVGNFLVAIPNGGARHKAVAAKLKSEGVRAGFPDLFLCHPVFPYHGLMIELKTTTGRVSPSQQHWLNRLASQQYACAVCYSWQEAQAVITDYLNGKHPEPLVES